MNDSPASEISHVQMNGTLQELEAQRNIIGGRAASIAGALQDAQFKLLQAGKRIADLTEENGDLVKEIQARTDELREAAAKIEELQNKVEDFQRADALRASLEPAQAAE